MENASRDTIYQIALHLDVRDIVSLMQCNKRLWRFFNDEPRPPRGHMGNPMALDWISNKRFWIPKGIQLGIFPKTAQNIGNARLRCIGWAKNSKRHLHAQVDRLPEKHNKIRNLSESKAIKKAYKCKKAFRTYKEYEDDVAEHLGAHLEGDNYVRPVIPGPPKLTSIFDPRLGAEDEYGSISVARFNNMDENREMLEEDYDDAIYNKYWDWIEKGISKQAEHDTKMEDKRKRFADKMTPGSHPNNAGSGMRVYSYVDVINLAAIDLQEYSRQKAQIVRPNFENVWYEARILPQKNKEA